MVPPPKTLQRGSRRAFWEGAPCPPAQHAPKDGEASNAECQFRLEYTPGVRSRPVPRRKLGTCSAGDVSAVKLARQTPGRAVRPATPYLGSFCITVTTCWNVGRFWNGKAPMVMPEVTTGRFWSKQEGCGLVAQAPLPPPYIAAGLTFSACARLRWRSWRQRFFEPLPQ